METRSAWACSRWALFETMGIMSLSIYVGLVNDVVPRGLQVRFYSGVRVARLGATPLLSG